MTPAETHDFYTDSEIIDALLQNVYLETPESARRELDKPLNWERRAKRQDWRVYIPSEVAAVWDDLPDVAKAVAYVTAKARTRHEH